MDENIESSIHIYYCVRLHAQCAAVRSSTVPLACLRFSADMTESRALPEGLWRPWRLDLTSGFPTLTLATQADSVSLDDAMSLSLLLCTSPDDPIC
jgi:hypothetical protein